MPGAVHCNRPGQSVLCAYGGGEVCGYAGMTTSHNARSSLYQQVANLLRASILETDSDRPLRLPAEPELATRHGVSRATIRQALGLLGAEGLIERTPGRGTVTVPSAIREQRRLSRHLIGVVSRWDSRVERPSSFYGQLYQGIAQAAEEAEYRIRLDIIHGAILPSFPAGLQPFDRQEIVGAIAVGIVDERLIRMHLGAGYPLVCADYYTTIPEADVVVVDCFTEGYMAAQHLLGLGHRHLFYLGNILGVQHRRQHEPDADLLEAGLRRALREVGLPGDNVFYCRSDGSEAREAARWVLSLHPRPTAGVVFQLGAASVLRDTLAGEGVLCPRDISLLARASIGEGKGFDAFISDPLQIGRQAFQMLMERISGRRQQSVRVSMPSVLRPDGSVRRCEA